MDFQFRFTFLVVVVITVLQSESGSAIVPQHGIPLPAKHYVTPVAQVGVNQPLRRPFYFYNHHPPATYYRQPVHYAQHTTLTVSTKPQRRMNWIWLFILKPDLFKGLNLKNLFGKRKKKFDYSDWLKGKNGCKYKYFDSPSTTYPAAELLCENEGGWLAHRRIKDKDIKDLIIDALGAKGAWLGIRYNDASTANRWEYEDGTSAVGADWASGQKDDYATQKCGRVGSIYLHCSTKEIFSDKCSYHRKRVCEYCP